MALGYITVFQLAKRKALQIGELKRPEHGRTLWESTKYYLIEFDGELRSSPHVVAPR